MKQFILVTLLSFPLWMTNCHSDSEEAVHQASPIKVKVMQVRSVGNYQTQTYSGTVEESSETALSFSVAGTIQQLKVQTGAHIQAGQLMATVNPATYQSSYKTSKSNPYHAERAYLIMKQRC